MVTIAEKIQSGFELARRITETLWLECLDPQHVSIDELRDHVSKEFEVEIRIRTLDVEAKTVFGFIERYDDGKRACVYIVKNISIRWKRLVGVKEICHVVVDTSHDWNPDGVDTLQRLMTFTLDIDAEENLALRSEHIAEMVAIELLYPHENRRSDLAGITAGSVKISDLAARYRLPESIIRMVLTPAYLSSCDKYWAAVDAARRTKVVELQVTKARGV